MNDLEREQLKKMVEEMIKPMIEKIDDLVKLAKHLPAFFEKLKDYEEIEKKVVDHHYLLFGVNCQDGLINRIKAIENKGKNNFNIFFKIVSLLSLIIGILVAIKQFI